MRATPLRFQQASRSLNSASLVSLHGYFGEEYNKREQFKICKDLCVIDLHILKGS